MIFKSKKENEYRDLIIAYKQVFGSEFGKRILMDLMNKFHILNSHKGEPYQEGQRSVVLEVMRLSNINLEHLDKMLKGDL